MSGLTLNILYLEKRYVIGCRFQMNVMIYAAHLLINLFIYNNNA